MMENYYVPKDLTLKYIYFFLSFLLAETEDQHSCHKCCGEISCGGGWRGGKVNTESMKCCPIAHSWTLQTKEG